MAAASGNSSCLSAQMKSQNDNGYIYMYRVPKILRFMKFVCIYSPGGFNQVNSIRNRADWPICRTVHQSNHSPIVYIHVQLLVYIGD